MDTSKLQVPARPIQFAARRDGVIEQNGRWWIQHGGEIAGPFTSNEGAWSAFDRMTGERGYKRKNTRWVIWK